MEYPRKPSPPNFSYAAGNYENTGMTLCSGPYHQVLTACSPPAERQRSYGCTVYPDKVLPYSHTGVPCFRCNTTPLFSAETCITQGSHAWLLGSTPLHHQASVLKSVVIYLVGTFSPSRRL
jgi:hypothetical protein